HCSGRSCRRGACGEHQATGGERHRGDRTGPTVKRETLGVAQGRCPPGLARGRPLESGGARGGTLVPRATGRSSGVGGSAAISGGARVPGLRTRLRSRNEGGCRRSPHVPSSPVRQERKTPCSASGQEPTAGHFLAKVICGSWGPNGLRATFSRVVAARCRAGGQDPKRSQTTGPARGAAHAV